MGFVGFQIGVIFPAGGGKGGNSTLGLPTCKGGEEGVAGERTLKSMCFQVFTEEVVSLRPYLVLAHLSALSYASV